MKSFDEFYESLWANIHKKRQRIKRGSGERMRKKGEKGAPTPAQMARAKETSESELADVIARQKASNDAFAQQKANAKRIDDRNKQREMQQKEREKQQRQQQRDREQQREEAPSLAVLKKKIKSGTKLGSTETASAKARGLIPRADGTKRKSPKYK